MMKNKVKVHFTDDLYDGLPACDKNSPSMEMSTDRRKVNCLRCKRTKLYKKGLRKRGYNWNSMDLVHSMLGGGCPSRR